MSIRIRLALWYAGALALALALVGVAMLLLLRQGFEHDSVRAQEARMAAMQRFLTEELQDRKLALPEEVDEFKAGLPREVHLSVQGVYTDAKGFPWSLVPGEGRGEVRWHGARYKALSRTLWADGRAWPVTFAVSMRPEDELVNRVGWLFVMLSPAAVALAALGGLWLSRRALQPVAAMTEQARRIGIHDMSSRLVVTRSGDELERLAETWNAMLGRLEDAVKELSRFTADASHELRTPIAVIRATAEIARRRSRSPEAYCEALDKIVGEAERMTALIDDLLFLARCDSDELDLPMSPVALAEVVNEVTGMMSAMAERRDVQVESAVEPVNVWGNRSAIRRMLLVLVDNAVKYCRKGGTVRVVGGTVGEEVRLRVIDQGFGIAKDELPLMFQRFYRGERARASAGGYGLGLALAAGIAQRHGSAIEVSSVPEQGSTFAVALHGSPQ